MVWLLCFPHLLLNLLFPTKNLLPKTPHHHTNPAGQRVLGETKRLHQAKQKNRGNETLWPALWETMPETSISSYESLETGMRRGKAGSSQGRVSSTLSPAHIIVLCSTSTIVWAKPGASALTSNFLLSVGSIPGTVWNTALILEPAEKNSLLYGDIGSCKEVCPVSVWVWAGSVWAWLL